MPEASGIQTQNPATGLPGPVRVLRVAGGGDGVARLADGRTVFIPRTAPGDLVEFRIVHEARRFVRARLIRVLEPGPNRVDPACPHYQRDDCGGCQLQHLTLAAQLSAKQSIVGEALRRLGKLELPDPSIVPAERVWEYRTRITLAPGRGSRIGLHRYDRPGEVFQLERCLITDASLMRLWSVLQANRKLLPADLTHLVLRLDREARRHVVAETRGDRVWDTAVALAHELEQAGEPAVLWWHPEDGAARVLAGDSTWPATVFEQVNPAMGDTVRAYAIERLGEMKGLHAWDLYAGTGESTLELARRGATVECVESDPRALDEARKRLQAAGVPETLVRYVVARVEDVIADLRAPDLVLANPPRTGMAAVVSAAIAARRPPRTVYISCDPATLARDLERMSSELRATNVQGFDLFPQTAHVETVVSLTPAPPLSEWETGLGGEG